MQHRRLFGLGGLGVVVALGGLAVARCLQRGYGLGDGIAWLALSAIGQMHTRFAPGFSEKAYRQVELGMTQAQVRALLGDPIKRFGRGGNPDAAWRYADQVSGTDSFHLRDIQFSADGRVTRIWREVYID